MSYHHYTPSRRLMSMAELNLAKTLNLRLEAHLRSLAVEFNEPLFVAQADRVHYCSTFWQGQRCPVCGKMHQMHTTGCRHRLCPICATREARVTAMQALEVVQEARKREPDLKLSLLTLTIKNCQGPDLCGEVHKMLAAWSYMVNRAVLRNHVLGWARNIEIVPGIENDGTYHPHIHAILMHRPAGVETIAEFRDQWRAGMKLDYDPVCDLRPIEDEEGAVFEVSKYISKLTRVYDNSSREHDHVKFLTQAIYSRRLRSYGGMWRIIRQQLGQLKIEQMDDDSISEYAEGIQDLDAKCPNCGSETVFTTLRWAGLHYATLPDQIRVLPFPEGFK